MNKKNEQYKLDNKRFFEARRQEEGVCYIPGGIAYKVLASGDGTQSPKAYNIVTCHYRGSTIDGHVFDESYSSGIPAAFRVDELIEGFQMALERMHVGDHWEVYIPQQLGYGNLAQKDIPKYSTLIFEIQLEKIY